MNYDVGPMLNRTNQVRRAECIVDDEGDAMSMRHSSHALDIGHIGIWIAEGLGIDGLRVGSYSGLEGSQVIDLDDGIRDALRSQRVRDEVERAAIEVVGGHDVITGLCNVLQRIGDGCST